MAKFKPFEKKKDVKGKSDDKMKPKKAAPKKKAAKPKM